MIPRLTFKMVDREPVPLPIKENLSCWEARVAVAGTGMLTGDFIADNNKPALSSPDMTLKATSLLLCPTSPQQGVITPAQHLFLLKEKR